MGAGGGDDGADHGTVGGRGGGTGDGTSDERRAGPRRIGIMGGTFDPVHIGHLVVAEHARAALDLDEVVFLVAGAPWQKGGYSPPEHRHAMTVVATASHPAFTVSRDEIDRDGPTYTVDTLRRMRAADPAAALFFLVGADAVRDLHTWREAEACLCLATFVAAARPGVDDDVLKSAPLADRVTRVEVPGLAVSSTDVRRRFADGRPVAYLVPEAVERYARKHGLYR